MHANEIIMAALGSAVLIGGILLGGLGSIRCIRRLRLVSIGVVTAFGLTMLGALVAASTEGESYRLTVFWLAVLTGALAMCFFVAGLVGTCRASVRKPALLVALISVLVVPLFIVIGMVSRAMR